MDNGTNNASESRGSAGLLALFKRTGRPSPFSVGDLNALVKAIWPWQGAEGRRGVKLTRGDRGVIIELDPAVLDSLRTAAAGGGGGQIAVKLYDPTKACSAGTIYKIRTTDAVGTPGKYYCLKATPANATEPKHIPQLPDGSGQTDPEHADKHWEFITPAIICTPDGSVEI
jgi:hypothetical protein